VGSDLKLAQCRRCQAYTLLGGDAVAVAVDIVPVTQQRLAECIVERIGLFWVKAGKNGTQKLSGAFQRGQRPEWGPNGAQIGVQRVYAEHWHLAREQQLVEVPKASDPCPAPVTPGGPRDGSRHPNAPAGATGAPERPSRAAHATPLLSRPFRCSICDHVIEPGEDYNSIEFGTWHWACHMECP
jgi:hypothetical protein